MKTRERNFVCVRTRGCSFADIDGSWNSRNSCVAIILGLVASFINRKKSMTRELSSSDSSVSASISSTAQFSIISSSNVLTNFNFSFSEEAIKSRRCLLIDSSSRRLFASLDSFVITLRFHHFWPEFALVFRPFCLLQSQGISAPR